MKEISAELAEEQARRKNRLQELEADLKRLEEQRHSQEAAVQTARQIAATLQEQAAWWKCCGASWMRSSSAPTRAWVA